MTLEERSAYSKRYRADNLDRLRAQGRAAAKRWNLRNKEKVKNAKTAWKRSNPAKVLESASRNYQKHKLAKLEYYRQNREKVLARAAKRYRDNPDEFMRRCKSWQTENPEKFLTLQKEYRLLHPEMASKRRATRQRAVPAWVDWHAIHLLYTERDRRTAATGVVHHVDHIVPICGKTVCGLHVPWNLQVLEASENLRKSNKLLEDVCCLPV